MAFFQIFLFLIMGATVTTPTNETNRENKMLFDFTSENNVDNWKESSDTVRTVGKSKGVLTLQKTQVFQRGIFFTLLNPQDNGAGFAGVRMSTNWNLSNYQDIQIKCRGQGQNDKYKVVLRHHGQCSDNDVSYEQFFTAPMSSDEFSIITLPLQEFKPYHRGKLVPEAAPLDTTNITMFGLQIYGGVYSPFKQKGVSTLEIDTIIATIKNE